MWITLILYALNPNYQPNHYNCYCGNIEAHTNIYSKSLSLIFLRLIRVSAHSLLLHHTKRYKLPINYIFKINIYIIIHFHYIYIYSKLALDKYNQLSISSVPWSHALRANNQKMFFTSKQMVKDT